MQDINKLTRIKQNIYYLKTQDEQFYYTKCKKYKKVVFNKEVIFMLHKKRQIPHMYLSYITDTDMQMKYTQKDIDKYLKRKDKYQAQLTKNNIGYSILEDDPYYLKIVITLGGQQKIIKLQFQNIALLNNVYNLLIEKQHEMQILRNTLQIQKQQKQKQLLSLKKSRRHRKDKLKMALNQIQYTYDTKNTQKKYYKTNQKEDQRQKIQLQFNKKNIQEQIFKQTPKQYSEILNRKTSQKVQNTIEQLLQSIYKIIQQRSYLTALDQKAFIKGKLQAFGIKILQNAYAMQKFYEQKIKELQNQINILKINQQKQLKQIEQYKIKNQQLQNQIIKLEKINKNLQQQNIKKNIQNQQKIKQINRISFQNLQKIINQQNIKLKQYSSQKNTLEINLLKQKHLVQKLQSKIQQLQQQNRSLSNQLNQLPIKLKQQYQNLKKQQILQAIQFQRQKLKLQYNDIISQIRLQSNNVQLQMQKIKSIQSQNIYRFLLKGQLLDNYQIYKEFIVNMVQEYTKKDVINSKLLFKFDKINKSNFHHYIDNHPNVIVIIKTITGYFLAGFSQSPFHPTIQATEGGMLMSLNNKKVFKLYPNKRSVSYDDYYLIFGNSQIRLKSLELKVFSNFAISNSFYNNQGNKVQVLLGEPIRQIQLQNYEIHQLFFKE